MVDTGYVYLPKMDLLLSPFFYRQLNNNNKIFSHNSSVQPCFYKVRLLKPEPPVVFVDDLCREVYGKDESGNIISKLDDETELSKVVRDKAGELVLYYKKPKYTLNTAGTGYDVSYIELVDEYKTFTKVLDTSKFVHQQYTDKTHTTNSNNKVDPNKRYISRNPDKDEGILLDGFESYLYSDFDDKNGNPYYLTVKFDKVNDGGFTVNVEQVSQNMKIIGDDGDEDSPINIGGFIVYDNDNKFLLGYGLFDESQEISGFLNVEDFDFKEWLKVDLTCKFGG